MSSELKPDCQSILGQLQKGWNLPFELTGCERGDVQHWVAIQDLTEAILGAYLDITLIWTLLIDASELPIFV